MSEAVEELCGPELCNGLAMSATDKERESSVVYVICSSVCARPSFSKKVFYCQLEKNIVQLSRFFFCLVLGLFFLMLH